MKVHFGPLEESIKQRMSIVLVLLESLDCYEYFLILSCPAWRLRRWGLHWVRAVLQAKPAEPHSEPSLQPGHSLPRPGWPEESSVPPEASVVPPLSAQQTAGNCPSGGHTGGGHLRPGEAGQAGGPATAQEGQLHRLSHLWTYQDGLGLALRWQFLPSVWSGLVKLSRYKLCSLL